MIFLVSLFVRSVWWIGKQNPNREKRLNLFKTISLLSVDSYNPEDQHLKDQLWLVLSRWVTTSDACYSIPLCVCVCVCIMFTAFLSKVHYPTLYLWAYARKACKNVFIQHTMKSNSAPDLTTKQLLCLLFNAHSNVSLIEAAAHLLLVFTVT